MIDLRHLRYFVTTAEMLNFTHAAEKLLVTQPTLSESIRELETELGTELFIRSTRHVSLSWPGMILLDETRRILRLIDNAVRLTREAADTDAVTLRVGVIEDQEPGILSKALARCRLLLPGMRPVIHVLPTALQLRALQSERLDLGIVIAPIEADGITMDLLWSEPLVLAMSRDHGLARQASTSIAGLSGEALILPDASVSPGYHGRILELCRAHGFAPKAVEHTFHIDMWLTQVAAGFGIALIPASIDTTRWPGIAVVPLTDAEATAPVMAAWRTENSSSALLAFVAALKSSRLVSPSVSGSSVGRSRSTPSGRPASGRKSDPPP